MNTRRLYRSRHDRQLAGVAAGMAEYLDLDPTLVRVLWVVSAFMGGFTILLYIVLAFVIPLAPAWVGPGPSWAPGGPWGQGGPWAPGAAPMPGGAPVAGAGGAPVAGAGGAPVAGAGAEDVAGATADGSPTQEWTAAQTGWDPAWTGGQAWAAQAPAAERRRGPGAAVYAGVLLVVFGAIALADSVIPGLAGVNLGPALLVALGAVLLIGSMRRAVGEGS